MNNLDIISKAKEYREMKRFIEEMQAAADSIADELKEAMNEAGESKMTVGEYKLSYIECKRVDVDKKRLENDHKALYDAYLKETVYMRFSVA